MSQLKNWLYDFLNLANKDIVINLNEIVVR